MKFSQTILTLALLVSISFAAPCCPQSAQAETPKPPTAAPKPPATTPPAATPKLLATPSAAKPTAPKPITPEAMKLLKALEAAGANFPVLTAKVNYNVLDRLTGDEETRTGSVAFQNRTAKTPARFAIRFETLALGKAKPVDSKLDYVYDGYWFHIAKHRQKTITRIEVTRPGQEADVLKIGKGPFPIPFGQKAADVARLFEVTTRAPRESDPKNTGYLRLVPRKEHKVSVKFTRMEIWIDEKTFLPMKVKTRDTNKAYTTATFSEIKKADKLADTLFVLKKQRGWTETVESMAKPKTPAKPTTRSATPTQRPTAPTPRP
jgi:hypothetical protein